MPAEVDELFFHSSFYSFNVGDFYRLHTVFLAQGQAHAGIVLAQQQRDTVGEQMRRLLRLIATVYDQS